MVGSAMARNLKTTAFLVHGGMVAVHKIVTTRVVARGNATVEALKHCIILR